MNIQKLGMILLPQVGMIKINNNLNRVFLNIL